MSKLLQAYQGVFPNLTPDEFTGSLRLRDIGDWDSMNTITLILFLEEAFGVTLENVELTRDTSVQDISGLLKSKGAVLD